MGRILRPAVIIAFGMGSFTFFQCNIETIREKRDPWNSVYAGSMTGFILGFYYKKRIDVSSLLGISLGLGLAFADIAGEYFSFRGERTNPPLRGKTYVESEELRSLKDRYPQYKDL